MQTKPYLLFDAGGTIVFPDQGFLIQEAQKYRLNLTHTQLYNGYYQLIYNLDNQARHRKDQKFSSFKPDKYAYHLFETLQMVNPTTKAIARAFRHRHEQKNLWTFTFPWVFKTLSELARQGCRMSVLSNSDGRTKKVIEDLGLGRYFEHIFDSEILGIEKPNPVIFEKVLAELNLPPAEVIYIGDIFYVDVLGANRAGLGGLHLDPLGQYTDNNWPGVHLTDIRHLPDWLGHYATSPSTFDLLPTKYIHQATPFSIYFKNFAKRCKHFLKGFLSRKSKKRLARLLVSKAMLINRGLYE